MSGHVYGYISNASDVQTAKEQRARMICSGVAETDIVVETKGKNKTRPKLKKLLCRLRTGDTLVVEGIYGLGNNYNSIADNLNRLNQIGGICIVLLDMPILSERSASDPLLPVVSELVAQTILYVIQHHKELRNSLQKQGIDSAKARGVQFGRPAVDLPGDYDSVVRMWRNGDITAEEAAQSMNISRSTFFRRVKGSKSSQSI